VNQKTVIELHDVNLVLGSREIFHNINLSISEGEFITILGPNGAGKSTFLKLLLGLNAPTSGQVKVLGRVPTKGNNEIGYVPQHRSVDVDLALQARDVVGFGLDGDKWGFGLPNKHRTDIINKVLEEVDMLNLASMPVGKLSGGEQQRLLIAQALLTDPKILLLDEPLSNLDISHAQAIVSLIKKIADDRNITVLLVTHDVNLLLGVIDRAIYMVNTRSVIGRPDQIINTKQLSELYGSSVEVINTKGRIFVVGEKL